MGYSINVDIGGTFTDIFAGDENGFRKIPKTPSTHYNLSVGFMKGVRDLARKFELPLSDFLYRTDAVRYCTTVGTNALIERTGPKLGFLTTAGFEDAIFIGRGRSWADGGSSKDNKDLARIRKPDPLIAPDMVVGVRERIDSFGNIVSPLTRADVLEKLQGLVDRGAMGFVVGFLWSFANPVHERMIKEIIEEKYPEDYLGSMPVTLSSDISPKFAEYTRFTTTIVNAYIHGVMAEELTKLGNELREGGYKRPLVLVHNTGGMKKMSRTRAVLTHNAGLVAGLHGALHVGAQYGYENIIFTDIGGTSFDIGVITGGRLRTYDFIPLSIRWRTNIPAVEVKSIGAGGGSIAWVNTLLANALEVGPQSAGSVPGPACYNQGGREPTVTDADLVLGYLNPENYLGGRMAYEQAGISPEDLSVVECHDAFTISEILHCEALGLCSEGEGGRVVEEGHTTLGGRIPVNPSGGLLSRGHPVGATGVAQIVEVVTQLRHEAGPRQVEGARVGLAQCMGGDKAGDTKSCTVSILSV